MDVVAGLLRFAQSHYFCVGSPRTLRGARSENGSCGRDKHAADAWIGVGNKKRARREAERFLDERLVFFSRRSAHLVQHSLANALVVDPAAPLIPASVSVKLPQRSPIWAPAGVAVKV